MRKLALLLAAGGLWLFVAALPAFADGGPHVAGTNNGTAGISADTCAGCHRAHTATASALLNSDQPALCLNCHDGSKATVDVVDGVQYTATAKTGPILGALRGGGFQYALIDSSNAARLSYLSGTSVRNIGHVQPLATAQKVTSTHGGTGGIYNAGWGTGTVWGNGAVNSGVGATVDLECTSCHNPHGNGQYRILQTTSDFSADQIVSGTWTKSTYAVQITDTTTAGTHNYTIKPATDGYNANGSAANIVTADNGDYWRYHWDPTGTLSWALTSGGPGADPMNTGWNGASATNAQAYKTTTLAAAVNAAVTTFTVASGTGFPAVPFLAAVDSETVQVTAMSGTGNVTWTVTRAQAGTAAAAHSSGAQVSLATTLGAGALAADKCLAVTSGTGFPSPSFFVAIDSEVVQVTSVVANSTCASGWTVTRGVGGTTAAAHSSGATVDMTSFKVQGTNGASLLNSTGLMTAWCIQCHTRYNGYSVDANGALTITSGNASSLSEQLPADRTFDYKHGTTRIGCEQCHVSHGSDALMTGTNSLNYTDPTKSTVPPFVSNVGPGNGVPTSGDSRLLKVDNRGTCQLCHDPTGTVTAGTYVGPTPTPGN